MYSFGQNQFGQLGHRSLPQAPARIEAYNEVIGGIEAGSTYCSVKFDRVRIVQVSAGGSTSLMVDERGRVFLCGYSKQWLKFTSLQSSTKSFIPRQIVLDLEGYRTSPASPGDRHPRQLDAQIVMASAGTLHSMFLSKAGQVLSVGRTCPRQDHVRTACSFRYVQGDPLTRAMMAGPLKHQVVVSSRWSASTSD